MKRPSTRTSVKRVVGSAPDRAKHIAEEVGVPLARAEDWLRDPMSAPERLRRFVMAAAKPAPFPGPEAPTFIFADVFSGIGGFRLALQSAGGRCAFSCERDTFARRTYRANFGLASAIHDDVRTLPALVARARRSADESPFAAQIDVVAAGFPCQPFSLAGVSKKNSLGRPHGFLDRTQGTLFHDLARLIRIAEPRALLLENVLNILHHDRGRTLSVILSTLKEDLGYDVQVVVVDASRWVPQRRKRVFFVATRADVPRIRIDPTLSLPFVPSVSLADILHPEDGTEQAEDPYTIGDEGLVSPRYTLSGNLWTYLREYKKKHESAGHGFGYGLFERDDIARTLSARYHKDGADVLISRGRGRIPRRLTPRECARLMGFEGSLLGNERFSIPVSDSQAYRQFGNAVVVPAVRSLALSLAAALKGEGVTP